MGLQELSDLLDRLETSLEDVEYKLTGLSLMASANRYTYLVRASREVAQASANLMQLEAERISLVSHLASTIGFPSDASLRDIVNYVGSPWRERFSASAVLLKDSLERISALQGEVRYLCQDRIGVFDTALSLIGGSSKVYGASGEVEESNSKILSEAM